MIIDELVVLLGYDIQGEAERKRFEAGLDNLRTKMRGFATAAVAVGAAAGAAVAAGFGLMGRSMVQTSAQFEGFQVALETLEGSAAKAETSMDWISEFARRTPYEVAGLTDAFIKLKAYGIDPIANDTLQVLGDTASAMNKPLEMAVEALADAASFQFERLREFGITTQQEGDQVVFNWTKNGKNVSEIVGKTGEDIRRFLLDNFGARFGGAMEKQSNTFNGIMSNVRETWTDFQRKIGDAGAFDVIKGQLAGLLESFTRWENDGTIDRWAERFSDAYTWVFNATETAVQHISQQIATLLQVFESPAIRTAAKVLGVALAVAFAWAFPVVTGIIALGLAIDDLISYIGGGESVIGSFIEWMKRLGDTIGQGFDAEQFRKIGDNLAEMIFGGFKWAVARLFVNMTWMLRFIWDGLTGTSGERGAGEAAGKIAQWFFDSLKAAWFTFEGLVNGLIGEVIEWFTSTDWAAVGAKMVNDLFAGMQAIGGKIAAWFSGLMPDWAKGFFSADPVAYGPTPGQRGTPARTSAARDRTTGVNEYAANLAHSRSRMGAGAATATVNDQRNQSSQMENHITINQTVTQPTNAPMTAATATSRAVGDAMTSQARVQAEGAR